MFEKFSNAVIAVLKELLLNRIVFVIDLIAVCFGREIIKNFSAEKEVFYIWLKPSWSRAVILSIKQNHIIYAVIITFLVVLTIIIIYNNRTNKFLKYTWDLIHLYREEVFTIHSRTDMELVANVKLRTLREIELIDSGSYKWSGNSFNLQLDDTFHKDFKLITENVNNSTTCVKYSLQPTYRIRKLRTMAYRLKIEAKDDSSAMLPRLTTRVIRPTKKLILKLRVSKDVKIANVQKIINSDDTKEFVPYVNDLEQTGNKEDDYGYNTYKFEINSPKLFARYIIKWDFV